MSMVSSHMELDRRSLLKGIGAAGASLTAIGPASAGDGSAVYVVTGTGAVARDRIADAGFEIVRETANAQVLGVKGPAAATEELSNVRGVSAVSRDVEVDFDVPVAPREAGAADAGPVFAENQWDNGVIDVGAAREIATGEGTSVAVVDTGIDFDHPDLGNVRTDLGAAFVQEDDSPGFGADDPRGHGTAVAGVVGATGAFGITGVAPDADLIPIRVFPAEGGAFFSDIFAGIDYAATVGADAANFSLGTPGALPPQVNRSGIRAAVQRVYESAVRRGTVVTASAGNAGANLQQGGFFTLPTSVPGTISVSATGPNDELAYYSNFGTNEIDLGAPGGGYETPLKTLYGIREWVLAGRPLLRSEHPLDEGEAGELWFDEDGNLTFDPDEIARVVEFRSPEWPSPFNFVFSTYPVERGAYVFIIGTSFAAPQVAGLAALIREIDPDLNPKQVETAMERGAELTNGSSDPELGAGRINTRETVELVSAVTTTRGNGGP